MEEGPIFKVVHKIDCRAIDCVHHAGRGDKAETFGIVWFPTDYVVEVSQVVGIEGCAVGGSKDDPVVHVSAQTCSGFARANLE